MDKNSRIWLAGSSASLIAGVICGLTVWSLLEEHLLPDLSEGPSIVSHYSRKAASPAPHHQAPASQHAKGS